MSPSVLKSSRPTGNSLPKPRHEIDDQRTFLGVRRAREIALWFIEQDISSFATDVELWIDQLAADLYVVLRRVSFCSELGYDLAVDR